MDEYDIDAYLDSVYEGGGFGRRKEYSSDSDSCCSAECCYDPYNADWSDDENSDFPSICANLPPISIPDLKEIASLNIAVALWNHKSISQLESQKLKKHSPEWDLLRNGVSDLTRELHLPKSIVEEIYKNTYQIGDEITKWVSYHSEKILSNPYDYSLYCVIPKIVWYSNSTINCKQTAKNMQSSQLSDATKYEFLFTYCLEDEIKLISSSSLNNLLINEKILMNFSSYPLIHYWIYYIRNELQKVPVNANLSTNSFMFRHHRVSNWSAKEYFFNRMTSDEQIQGAVFLINDSYGRMFQKPVLMTMNESQRLQVYMHSAAKIMMNYALQSNNSKDLLSTWFEIRNLITQDEFVSVFSSLLEQNMNVNSTVLADIWSSASVSFKNHLLNYSDHKVVKNLLKIGKWNNDGDILYTMLSNANSDIKKNITKSSFFNEYCEGLLVRRCKSRGLDKLINLCFPDDQEAVKFKQNLVINSPHVKHRCFRYFDSGNVKRLNESLMLFLSSYPDLIVEYKKNLILSADGIANCVNYMESTNLHKIISDCLPDSNEATAFKKRMIFSPKAIEKLHYKMLNSSWYDIDACMNRYLTSNEDKNALKKLVVDDLVKLIRVVFYQRDESWWQSLMLWYLNSAEAIREFKLTLPIDNIFNDMLKYSIFKKYDDSHRLSYCTFKNQKCVKFEPLNRFLNWYFGTSDEVKEYKMRRVDSYQNIDMINTLLKKKDDRYLRLVMNWFFGDDVVEIDKFKKAHSGKIITLV